MLPTFISSFSSPKQLSLSSILFILSFIAENQEFFELTFPVSPFHRLFRGYLQPSTCCRYICRAILMDMLDMWDMEGARPVWFNVRQYSPPTTGCRNAADFYYWRRKHWNSSITGRDLDNVQKHWMCNQSCAFNLCTGLSHAPQSTRVIWLTAWTHWNWLEGWLDEVRYTIIIKVYLSKSAPPIQKPIEWNWDASCCSDSACNPLLTSFSIGC